MDYIRQYDKDCLSHLDTEYDNPVVRDIVQTMVAEEMSHFIADNYLAKFQFDKQYSFDRSPMLKEELKRLESGQPRRNLPNLTKYNVEAPAAALEKDVQSWRKSVATAKIVIAHNENKQLNLELSELYNPPMYLKRNVAIEQLANYYATQSEAIQKQIREVNNSRRLAQERAFPELAKLTRQAQQSFNTTLQIRRAVEQIKDTLAAHGHDYEQYLQQLEIEQSRNVDVNDAAVNSTVREYEAINEQPPIDAEDTLVKKRKHSENDPSGVTVADSQILDSAAEDNQSGTRRSSKKGKKEL